MYRKDDRNFFKSNTKQSIKVGLPKGNIYTKSIDLVEQITGNKIKKGTLFVEYENYIFYFVKHRDIPNLIDSGKLDFGITSQEWLYESEKNLIEFKKLDWCDTSICLISNNRESQFNNCVSEYPNLTKKFFTTNNITANIEYVSGSCEALVPTMFDCCVGCVESGKTLRENNLMVIEKIIDSKIVFIGKDNEKYKSITKIINNFI